MPSKRSPGGKGENETPKKKPAQKKAAKEELKRSAADFLPQKNGLDNLRDAASQGQGCDLYKNATQTAFGEGSSKARIMFIGEQPGDVEDKQGHPFVGLQENFCTKRWNRPE